YPLAESGCGHAFLFGWPSTVDNAHVIGHRSVAVPGTVSGLALALERYGTMSLREVLAPAIALAADGPPVPWHPTLTSARDPAHRQGPRQPPAAPGDRPPLPQRRRQPAGDRRAPHAFPESATRSRPDPARHRGRRTSGLL